MLTINVDSADVTKLTAQQSAYHGKCWQRSYSQCI